MKNRSKYAINALIFLALQVTCSPVFADFLSANRQTGVIPSQRSVKEMSSNSDKEKMDMKTKLYNDIIGHLPPPSSHSLSKHSPVKPVKTQDDDQSK